MIFLLQKLFIIDRSIIDVNRDICMMFNKIRTIVHCFLDINITCIDSHIVIYNPSTVSMQSRNQLYVVHNFVPLTSGK
jgi:hypothetical protein